MSGFQPLGTYRLRKGSMASRVRVIYYDLAHTQDIYGQMVVYVRLNGITPPASNRGV